MWVKIEPTAINVDRCFEVLAIAIATDATFDRHDLAVHAFVDGIGDDVGAVAHDVG